MEKYLYSDLFELEDTHWWHISKRRTLKKLVSNNLKNKRLKILDMGCGTGRNIIELNTFGTVFGIDSSKDAVFYCKKRNLKNISLANTYNSGFNKNTFDLITLLDVLEHTDDHKTLLEISRILKNNGNVLITVPAFNWLWSEWDNVLHHRRRYNKKALRKILNDEGFEIVKISYVYSFLVIPVLLIRWLKMLINKRSYSSDFKLSNPIINKIMILICDFERAYLVRFFIPFGTSLVVLAKKSD